MSPIPEAIDLILYSLLTSVHYICSRTRGPISVHAIRAHVQIAASRSLGGLVRSMHDRQPSSQRPLCHSTLHYSPYHTPSHVESCGETWGPSRGESMSRLEVLASRRTGAWSGNCTGLMDARRALTRGQSLPEPMAIYLVQVSRSVGNLSTLIIVVLADGPHASAPQIWTLQYYLSLDFGAQGLPMPAWSTYVYRLWNTSE
jgi:hypothetical protein